ncbi:anti-sigma factor domain-containing protein [Bradyrhizobium sp.]|uniref:anti-sigma factor n=1 Tax=Bradyrhizobium sp. TaxID=376 RepID=UPI002730DA84|nr:anti-sigma factor [Bradyrhizobium sp.]MDP1865508.1 anti-sigma factor [Bradyrhizobium sp.]MDP3075284.1 anti-sigma factor [Bradyrhizobium sp.]
MAYSEDHIALAAEYALGTLDADERAQVETMMSVDKEFTAMVEAWQQKLGVLNQMVGSVEPRPEVWDRIKTAIGHSEPQAPLLLPDAPPPPLATDIGETAAPVDTSNVIQLSARAKRWRNLATLTTAIAAALVAMIATQLYAPDRLPDGLRPKVRTQVVEVKTTVTPPPSGQFVALLQKDSTSPAFILTVDGASKNFTVRRVGATPEPGKSFELWLVSDKLPGARSLGVIGGNDFTTRPALTAYDTDTVNKATYAVTLEPEGGSPTGVATGPVVFTGKLIEAVPPAAAAPAR